MASLAPLPGALEAFRRALLHEQPTGDHILGHLRSLQRMGQSKQDLVVHVTRIRDRLDAADPGNSEGDLACVAALDLIHGYGANAMRWDPPRTAILYLSKVLTRSDLVEAARRSAAPNDLLPPRPGETDVTRLAPALASHVWEWISSESSVVAPADIFRSPHGAFATRPAALMPLESRWAYEALANRLRPLLDEELPSEVLWPRGTEDRTQRAESHEEPIPLRWRTPFIVKADIQNFYGSVSHSIMRSALSAGLGTDMNFGLAAEALLTATMRVDHGLPQGPLGSDVFAAALLLPIDRLISNSGVPWLRIQDDYFMGASSMREAQALLRGLEDRLHELGLTLNEPKTRILKRSTFKEAEGQKKGSTTEIRRVLATLQSDDAVELPMGQLEEMLTKLGVDDERLWALFYEHSADLADVVEELAAEHDQDRSRAHLEQFETATRILSREGDREAEPARLEPVLRNSLLSLAETELTIEADDLATALRWFPALAPHATHYLKRLAREAADVARQTIGLLVDELDDQDWLCAWLLSSLREVADWSMALEEWLLLQTLAESRPLAAAMAAEILVLREEIALPRRRAIAISTLSILGEGLKSELVFVASAYFEAGSPSELTSGMADNELGSADVW